MYKYKSTCRFKMLVFAGKEILEVRPQEVISSKTKLDNSYLKLIPEVNKKKSTESLKTKPKKDVDNGDDR